MNFSYWSFGFETETGKNQNDLKIQCEVDLKITPPKYPLPDGYTSHDTAWGTVYTKIYDDFYVMEEGQALCANDALGHTVPHMPIPFDYDQNDFFFNLVGTKKNRDLWLGINDKAQEGNFTFRTGEYLKLKEPG